MNKSGLPQGIGPHEGRELELLLTGAKPVARFNLDEFSEDSKAAFRNAVIQGALLEFDFPSSLPHLHRRYYCRAGEEWRVKLLELIERGLVDGSLEGYFSEEDLHRMDGTLLGYERADIDVFIEHARSVRANVMDKVSVRKTSRPTGGREAASPSGLIDAKIAELRGWRGETLARLRAVIRQADPEIVEDVKWRKPSNPSGVPVWEHDGLICTGETYKDKVKLTFAQGASLDDPKGLFNSSLEGNLRRAIDFHEGGKIDEAALKALVRAAVAFNTSKKAKSRK